MKGGDNPMVKDQYHPCQSITPQDPLIGVLQVRIASVALGLLRVLNPPGLDQLILVLVIVLIGEL